MTAGSPAAPRSPGRTDEARELEKIQRSVRPALDAVTDEMKRSVTHESPLVARIGEHLMGMRGKLFRPTLLLLCSRVDGKAEPKAVNLAAAVELIHLATLVHDDAVDHSVLRRGMPTLNSLFSHQISVIMGDFLYSTALGQLVSVGDLESLRVLTRASTEMSVGELRQRSVIDSLSFAEHDYYALIRSKTASLISAACEVGAICGASRYR
ncbi:MAG: polyprenyl synthetase family protein, partial [Gemmatimonadaceae bacterium]